MHKRFDERVLHRIVDVSRVSQVAIRDPRCPLLLITHEFLEALTGLRRITSCEEHLNLAGCDRIAVSVSRRPGQRGLATHLCTEVYEFPPRAFTADLSWEATSGWFYTTGCLANNHTCRKYLS